MNAEDQSAASDASEQTEPQVAVEQEAQTESDYGATLLKLAASEGHAIGDDQPIPKEPEESESETETAPPPETEEEAEDQGVAAEKEDKWSPSAAKRVAEETAKRKRANAERDSEHEARLKAEQKIQELERSVMAMITPPTEDNPFADIRKLPDLERLERSYEKAIDLADENPDGAIDVLIGRNEDGGEVRRDFSQEELVSMRRKAEKAIRKQIPERRTYLQQQAVADAQATAIYPELQNPDSEFSQQAAMLAYQILSGKAAKEPELLTWVAHAVKGYRDFIKSNGGVAKSPGTTKILQSAQQQIAPTTTRTRSFGERRGADLGQAEKELENKGTPDAAEKYVAALFAKRGASSRKLEPLAE